MLSYKGARYSPSVRMAARDHEPIQGQETTQADRGNTRATVARPKALPKCRKQPRIGPLRTAWSTMPRCWISALRERSPHITAPSKSMSTLRGPSRHPCTVAATTPNRGVGQCSDKRCTALQRVPRSHCVRGQESAPYVICAIREPLPRSAAQLFLGTRQCKLGQSEMARELQQAPAVNSGRKKLRSQVSDCEVPIILPVVHLRNAVIPSEKTGD